MPDNRSSTPRAPVDSISRRATIAFARVASHLMRRDNSAREASHSARLTVRASLQNSIIPVVIYITVATTLMSICDHFHVSAGWPRHWLLIATGVGSVWLAERRKARVSSVLLAGATVAMTVRLALQVAPVTLGTSLNLGASATLALAGAVGYGLARLVRHEVPATRSTVASTTPLP